METFELIVGILLILGYVTLSVFWWWRYPYPFGALLALFRNPTRILTQVLVIVVLSLATLFAGIFLIRTSLT